MWNETMDTYSWIVVGAGLIVASPLAIIFHTYKNKERENVTYLILTNRFRNSFQINCDPT